MAFRLQDKGNSFLVYFSALLAVAAWGGSFAAAKVALEQISPLLIMFGRFVFSLLMLLPIAYFCGELALPKRKQCLVLAFMGFFGFFFHLGIQTLAMKTAGSATANWQMASAPAITAALAAIFLKEKLSGRGMFGVALAFLGVAVVLSLGTQGKAGISAYSFGDFLISVSALNWAAFMVITRWLFRDGAYPPVFTIFWEMFFAVLMCIPALYMAGEDVTAAARFTASTWGALAFLGIVCSGLAYVCWYYAAARIPIAELMVFQFFQPLVGALVGYLVIGERFTLWLFVGGAMIIAGVWAVNRK